VSCTNVVGAGYVSAMLNGDEALSHAFEEAFSAGELLAAVHVQLMILGRRVAADSNRTLAELGDHLVGSAVLLQRLDATH
jgi:hypothetical protein